ncbi:MAG: GGDEF domain-containing protein [Oxalobacteraceae bacterium]|nr:GGDEF domain-containing protein [Oxalobacteraceae bacterium]
MLEQRAKAFDFLFDAVVVVGMDSNVLDWNRGAEKLYGWSRQEIIGKPVSMLYLPEDVASFKQDVMEAVLLQGHWTGEVRMRRKDGRIGYTESVVVPLEDDQHKVIGVISINRDVTARIDSERRLKYLAFNDALTGVGNRELALERLKHAMLQVPRRGTHLALIFVDLDNFKQVNDVFGHAAGDAVLCEVASRLKQTLRAADTVARIGGDEFLLIAEDLLGRDEALEAVERIAQALLRAHSINGMDFVVAASIGLALFPDDAGDTDTLLRFADEAMYRSKRSHHNTGP